MKLSRVAIQNFRSFPEKLELPVAEGMNALVGPNNCGKSNFLRAVGMALDPDYPFDTASDVPGQRKFAFPRTTLTFHCDGVTSSERTLLKYAEEYERSVVGENKATYAQDGQIRFVVTYRGNQDTGTSRQEYLAARGVGDRRGDAALNAKAIRQLRKVVRFATIDTGESLTSVLNGKFRDILHGVLKEHLKPEFAAATEARGKYISGLQEDLLTPLRDRLLGITTRLFPEVCSVGLLPTVSEIDETLSNVEIRIRDSVDTPLHAKGMGVTGAVLIALLRYLADASKQSLIFAIEEPEAFLHPGAQESLRDDLEALAERNDVSLLVTTHSPFILSRAAKAQVVAIAKDGDGVSRVEATAAGSESQATAISGLFRDSTVPELLDRYAAIPATAEAILLVEGTTDADFLATAARVFGFADDMARIHVLATGGTDNLAAQAVLLRAEASQPVWCLLDSDENGRKARDLLTKRFGMPKGDVLEYSRFLGGLQDAESEWLFFPAFMQRFVDEHDEELVLKSKQKIQGEFRYDFTPTGKSLFPSWVDRNANAKNMARWSGVVETLTERLGEEAKAS
ncbi:AAA family ATPase [Nocardioides sp. LMS-CY]|uniref:ATP-dependent nuclease n=1 Tax=Nocardioides sp. (strain LMS-CY) TaxID=2840457 RepID=UPI001C001CB6|nr:AAA family ATPase [Nocardioides sp. LMS-CY]QWF21773.1 AAA family ATPase [Nocardioides sp. LMS-CY]